MPPAIPPDSLMTAADLAARLGVRPSTVHDWHRAGRIPGRRLSHRVLRFDLAEVVAALESASVSASRQEGGVA